MSSVDEINFKSGQLWKYYTRRGDENSRVLILKVETYKNEDLIHVTIIGEGIGSPIHMPFSEIAVRDSVISICAHSIKLPNFEEGYYYWKQQFTAGNAGVYMISIAEALDL